MKSIYAQHLKSHLPPLSACYILTGSETVLIEDSTTLLRASLKKQGYEERLIFTMESSKGFDWEALSTTLKTPSLFSDKKIVEWTWHQPLQEKDREAIETLFPIYDAVLIIKTGRLTKAMMQTKWFKPLSSQAIVVQHWPPQPHQWAAWIQERAKKYQISFEKETLQFLAEHFEGQLFAIDQLMMKLSLHEASVINLALVKALICEEPQGEVFALQDALLQQKPEKVISLLAQFKQSKLDLSLILWAVNRLLQSLYHAHHAALIDEAFLRKKGFLPKDLQPFKALIQKNSRKELENALQLIPHLDRLHKTGEQAECWQKMCQLCLKSIGA